MKLRFAFHSPKGERGVGKAIVGWTWILGCFYNWKVLKYNFSHVEVWLPDKNGRFWDIETCGSELIGFLGGKPYYYPQFKGSPTYLGQCFSSTTRGVYNGVRFAPASEIIGKHPERWSYIECDVDAERLEVALDEATLRVGMKYDFWALFGFFNPLPLIGNLVKMVLRIKKMPVRDNIEWYCSEICNWFGALCRVVKRFFRISPRRFCYVLAKAWHEPRKV